MIVGALGLVWKLTAPVEREGGVNRDSDGKKKDKKKKAKETKVQPSKQQIVNSLRWWKTTGTP